MKPPVSLKSSEKLLIGKEKSVELSACREDARFNGNVRSPFSLPFDVQLIISSYLCRDDKKALRLTCKAARELVDTLWKPLDGTD
jgi:hypothetical protein